MIGRDQVEVELKFRLASARAGAALIEASSLAGLRPLGGPSIVRIEDRYVDTSSGALRAAGYAARLRARPDGVLISVKSTARRDNGRVHRRRELEGPADASLAPAAWPPSEARKLLIDVCGGAPLEEMVTLRQVRRQREFGDGSSTVELSVDEVQVVVVGRVVNRFVELEAELLTGDPTILETLGEVLAAARGVTEATSSKLDAALAAIGRPVPAPGPGDPASWPGVRDPGSGDAAPAEAIVAPEPRRRPNKSAEPRASGIRADDTVAEAGRKVLAFHLGRMLAREPGTRAGDVGELHQMRVATRRMRAAWRVFGDGFEVRGTRRHRTRLRRVARLLGAVRDLDVLLEGLAAYRAALPSTEQRGLDPLAVAWERQRATARRAVLRELDSDPYRRWADGFLAFVQAEGLAARAAGPTDPQRIRDTAPARIWSSFAGVRAYEGMLRWADVTTLHELRIAGKWLRYTLEFHRDALGSEATGLIAPVTALQDHLGLLHDADVAADIVRAFLVDRGSTLSDAERAAVTRYLGDREQQVEGLRRGVLSAWRGVAGLTFRRRLGRLVAGL